MLSRATGFFGGLTAVVSFSVLAVSLGFCAFFFAFVLIFLGLVELRVYAANISKAATARDG
jgi:hypothetical protein